MYHFFVGMVLLNLLAVVFILIRPKLFFTNLYRPMLKNMLLSIIPMLVLIASLGLFILVTMALNGTNFAFLSVGVLILGIIVWVLMLPNSGYLITELNLNHRDIDPHEVPIYYDIISVLTLAMSGVVNTVANVLVMQVLVGLLLSPESVSTVSQIQFLNTTNWLFVIALNWLVSLGIYIGRSDLRFNSWDALHPIKLLKKLGDHFTKDRNLRNAVIFTIATTFFFTIMYYIMAAPILTQFKIL